jgi:DNA polymerase I
METVKFVLLDIDYITQKGKPVVRLFGKIPDGGSIIAHDKNFKPYIYILTHNIDDCINELSDLELHNLEKICKKDGGEIKNFLKISLEHPRDIPQITDKIQKLPTVEEVREHDIPFYRRYLIDNDLFPMKYMEVQGKVLKRHQYFKGTVLFEVQKQPIKIESSLPKLKILSFNIESVNSKGKPQVDEDPINMISFYSNQGFHKIFSTKKSSHDFVETVQTERELLKKFMETIKSENPDIIAGYNSDKFDFPYIKGRADILGVPLNLGVDGSKIKFWAGHMKYASIKGLVHVDLYKIVRRYLQLNDHTLEKVYKELYQEEKIDIPSEEVYKCWTGEGERLENLFRYALEDVKVISQIADKMLALIIEVTRIVGQPLFEITRRGTGTQVKWYLIRKAHENDIIVPNEFGKFERNVVGGYVEEPVQGLYENIVYFDFKSMYPSIIIAKNISPETLTEDDDKNCHVAPEFGYQFRKKPIGFIPSIVKGLLDSRIEIKAEMDKCTDPHEYQMLNYRQDAVKRLSSTVYGLFNHPQFRWYCVKCSEAITAWGKEFLQQTMKEAEQVGFSLLYADTDGFYAIYLDR